MRPKVSQRWILSIIAASAFCFVSELAGTATVRAAQETPPQQTQAAQNLDKVRNLIKDGKYAEAETLARELLAQAAPGADSLKVAEVLDPLVESLWRGGKVRSPESQKLAERAMSIKEKALGPDHPEVARSLDNLAILLQATRDYAGARPLFERALAIQEKALGPEHPDVAQSLTSLANLLYTTGNYAGARPLYERALAIREKALGPEHPDVIRSLNMVAVVLRNMADYAGARPLFERALAIREKALGPEHPDVAGSLNSLAVLLRNMGDYDGAKPFSERALAIQEKSLGPEHPAVAVSLEILATLRHATGDYAGAKPLFERALAITEKNLGPEHSNVAGTLGNLAILLKDMGDYAGARPLYERALTIFEKVLGPEHPVVARNLNNFAVLLKDIGDYAGARPLLERALAINEKALGLDHPDLAYNLNKLALLSRNKGDYAGARSLHERALALREKALGPDNPWVAESLNNLASLLRDTGDYARARPLYERVIAIREKALGHEHPLVAQTLNDFAMLLSESGGAVGALEAALRAEQIGRDHLHLTVRTLPERLALRYASVRAAGLNLALSIMAESDHELSKTRSQVWEALLRSRALILDEMAGRHRTVAEATQITRLAQALTSAYQRLANLTVRGPGNELPEQHRKLLDEARKEKEQAEQALAEKSITFRQEQTRNQLGFAQVAAALSPGSALVAFAHYDHYEAARKKPTSPTPSYLAFALRSGEKEPTVVPLGTAKEIETLVTRWSEEAAKGIIISGRSPKQTEVAYRKAGETLRRKIWDPIAKHLLKTTRVFVVPDGALNLVNLAALPNGQADYLVETGPLIHYLSAERDLVPSEAAGIKGEGLLVLGGPAFDETTLFAALNSKNPKSVVSSEALAMASPKYRGERSNCGDFQSMRFEPLPASGHEVKEIVSLWTKGSGAATVIDLTGAAASEAAFKEQASGRRVLHLATHGFFLAGRCPSALESARGVGGVKAAVQDEPPPVTGDNPLLLSGLALAGANHRAQAGPEEDDGILTAEEIAAMNLSGVEWAVLSACETGVGKVEAGEGVFGLRRAFQMAGAGTLIMSLWSVEDESARQWMAALYEGRLVKKLSTAESVRAASLEVLRSRREKSQNTHPFFWAGFVAAGDWR